MFPLLGWSYYTAACCMVALRTTPSYAAENTARYYLELVSAHAQPPSPFRPQSRSKLSTIIPPCMHIIVSENLSQFPPKGKRLLHLIAAHQVAPQEVDVNP